MTGLIVRAIGFTLGALLAWGGLSLAQGEYAERVHYPHACPCTEPGAETSSHGCLKSTTGRVVDKRKGGGMGVTYNLQIRWKSGATKWYDLMGQSPACYDSARRGSRADMVTWQGKLMKVTVRGKTCDTVTASPTALALCWLLIWAGAGLAVASLLSNARNWAGLGLGIRPAAWMGAGLLGYFPAIRALAGETQWWAWIFCAPLAAIFLVLALAPWED